MNNDNWVVILFAALAISGIVAWSLIFFID